MFVAALAGIEIFATGGIGGVHRGAEETFDISADLIELSRTKVAVVCAGAKSILDIAKTLEFLESQGVPVIGYRCDEFPAFFARSSGVQASTIAATAPMISRAWSACSRKSAPAACSSPIRSPNPHALDAGCDRGAHQ